MTGKKLLTSALTAGALMLSGCQYLSAERTPDPINNTRRAPSMNPGGDGYVHWRTPEEEWYQNRPQSAVPLNQNVAQLEGGAVMPAPTMQAAPVQPVIVHSAAPQQDAQFANIAPAAGVPMQQPYMGQAAPMPPAYAQPMQYAQAAQPMPVPPAMDQYVPAYNAPQGNAYPTLGQVPPAPQALQEQRSYYHEQVQQLEYDRGYNQQLQMNAPQPEPFYAAPSQPAPAYPAPQSMQQDMSAARTQPVSAPWYPVPPSDPSGQSMAQPEMQSNVQVQQAISVEPAQPQPVFQAPAAPSQPQQLGGVPSGHSQPPQQRAATATLTPVTLNPPPGYAYGARPLLPSSRYEARRAQQYQQQAQTRLY
jgi:hypothetical protein